MWQKNARSPERAAALPVDFKIEANFTQNGEKSKPKVTRHFASSEYGKTPEDALGKRFSLWVSFNNITVNDSVFQVSHSNTAPAHPLKDMNTNLVVASLNLCSNDLKVNLCPNASRDNR